MANNELGNLRKYALSAGAKVEWRIMNWEICGNMRYPREKKLNGDMNPEVCDATGGDGGTNVKCKKINNEQLEIPETNNRKPATSKQLKTTIR
jgi:hypothetical protein